MTYSQRDMRIPTASSVLKAALCWGLCTFTRSTGVVHSLFIAYFMLHKIFLETGSCRKVFAYIMLCWLTIVIMFVPLWTVIYWRPYMLHCETRMDKTNQAPIWCLDAMPNVYTYIQDVYWDNGFLAFLTRNLDHFITSLPMNFVLFYIVYRIGFEQTSNLLTLSFISSKVSDAKKNLSLFSQPEIVPHFYYMFLQLFVVLVYGNQEINSRVASSLPIYFWIAASMFVEGDGCQKSAKMTWAARLVVLHNLGYLIWNILAFFSEWGFY